MGSIGITADVREREDFLADAVRFEELGYSAVWVAGGQLSTLDPLTRLLEATRTIGVGSGIIPIEVIDATTVATTFAEVNSDRLIVGLGGGHGPRPLQTTKSYLDELGDVVPVSARMLAAMGPRKLELARERTSGATTLLITPDYVARAREILGDRAELVVMLPVVTDEDSRVARETARTLLGFLAEVPGYQASFRRMGFAEEDVSGLSDRLVDSLVAWGGTDAIANHVTELQDAGATHVALSIMPTGSGPDLEHTSAALADRLIR